MIFERTGRRCLLGCRGDLIYWYLHMLYAGTSINTDMRMGVPLSEVEGFKKKAFLIVV